MNLGGGDFDYALTDFVLDSIIENYGTEYRKIKRLFEDFVRVEQLYSEDRDIRRLLSDLVNRCEEAKEGLAEYGRYDVDVVYEGDFLSTTVTHEQLEEIVQTFVPRTQRAVEDSFRKAEENLEHPLEPEDLDKILLVGGSTRLPIIQQTVRSIFGKDYSQLVHPDEDVAIGAALKAASLLGIEPPEENRLTTYPITAHSIGIFDRAQFVPIIPHGTPIPCRGAYRIRVPYVLSEKTPISIVQELSNTESGDSKLVREQIYEIVVRSPFVYSGDEVEVRLEVNENSIVAIKAEHLQTGENVADQLEDIKMTNEEIERSRERIPSG
jgi:molecular chaperone DnaK